VTVPVTPGDPTESPPIGGLSVDTPKRASLITRVFAVVDRVNIPMLASALTFDALLALIPFGVLVFGGMGYLLDQTAYFGTADPGRLLDSFLPFHVQREVGAGPFLVVQKFLEAMKNFEGKLTLFAVPVFLWFATRLFASIRACLSMIYLAESRQRHQKIVFHVLLTFLFGKLRDLVMVATVVVFAGLSTVLSTLVSLLPTTDNQWEPPFSFLASSSGRLLTEIVAVGSAFAVFITLYRYASPKRMHWRGAIVASLVATAGFEIAKRLFGWYLAYNAQGGVYSVDATIGAVLLFLLWVWYSALVFLIGAAAAKVWEEGR
jgi:YihY family inner membrane protein